MPSEKNKTRAACEQCVRAVVATIFAVFTTAAVAQAEQTTGNLVYTTTNPAPTGTNIGQSWTGFSIVTSTGGNTTSDNGAVTGYNTSTGTFMFGYNQGTIAYTYAINQALANAGTGIQVRGYNWSWDINNLNYDNRQGSTDTLTARIITYGANNSTIRQTDTWTYNTKFDWTTFSGTVNYATPGLVSEYGNMRIEFTGRDTGFWAGYYGPMVRNIDVSLRYGVDPCAVDPQSSPACPGYKTYYIMTDDGYAQVNLPFAFPFYGQVYTTSYMYTNGVVGFLNPNWGGYCCDGTDLNQQRFQANSPWNYAIYALNTDLYPGANSRFYTQQTDNGTGIRYTWENVLQIGTNNENTFSVNIKDSGYIGINYAKINLDSWTNPLIGIAGDINQAQYYQKHYGPASTMTATAGTQYTFTGTETTDVCAANPLYNPQCPGYAAAYLSQQCSLSALYDPACPGYAAAYFTYQCTANPLYSANCPGYQQAYFNQQCGLDPLYNNQCPGYQQAYFAQQCSLDGLYDTACPNYADAYYVQQCTADPLYDSGCTGYAQAYALRYVVNAPVSTPTTDTAVTVATSGDPVAAAAPVVADPIVNQAVTTTATSASPAQAATATVPLVAAPQPVATTTATADEEKKTETSASKSAGAAATTDSKEQPKTTRQALAERNLAAARARAIEGGKNLANAMGEASSLEAQMIAQSVVIQAMGYTPGFDAYGRVTLPDAQGYRPFEIYQGQRNVDNPAGRRFLTGSDRLHTEMVDQQYGALAR